MARLMYCKKCGRIVENSYDEPVYPCDYCKSTTYEVPEEYLEPGTFLIFMKEELKEEFIEKYIKASPEFNQYLFDHRDGDLRKRELEYRETLKRLEEIEQSKPKCPTCGSKDISKIGTLGRMVSVGMFGLASSKIGKTHKCNNCGTTW